MKKNRFKLIALVVTLATVTTGVSLDAQRKDKRDDRVNNRERCERKDGRRDISHNSCRRHRKIDYKFDSKKKHKNSGYDGHNKYKKHQRHNHVQHNKYANKHYRHNDNWYRDGKYGVVYREFYEKPVRFRYRNCNYYYHAGHYYRHHNGIGYVRVTLPGHIVIERLPANSKRFTVHGHHYYRCGNLVFERYGHKYKVRPQLSIQLSARL